MKKIKWVLISALTVALPLMFGASGEGETAPVKDPAGQSQEKNPTDKDSGQQKTGNSASPSNVIKTTAKVPAYKPPFRGAPAGRVGGATRGTTERESFSLMVLAPDHAGFTTQDQPTLYWYISKPTTYPVEVTVVERRAAKPLFEKVLKAPDAGGIHALRLADYGIHISRDTQYKWFVTLVIDAEHRSKDILAGGIITLIDAPAGLSAKLEAAGSGGEPFVYAEEGLWYDALDSISRIIETSPNNAEPRRQRAALLEQVGLGEVADFESKQQPSSQ